MRVIQTGAESLTKRSEEKVKELLKSRSSQGDYMPPQPVPSEEEHQTTHVEKERDFTKRIQPSP